MKGKCPHCGKDINEPRKKLEDATPSRLLSGDWDIAPPNWFEYFWAGVPHKVGKKQAREEWAKLIRDLVDPRTIFAALPEYRSKEEAREKADGPAFRAHAPFRWLRDRRFEDEPAPEPIPKEAAMWELIQQEKALEGKLKQIKRKNQVADGHRELLTVRGRELSKPFRKKLETVQDRIIDLIDK